MNNIRVLHMQGPKGFEIVIATKGHRPEWLIMREELEEARIQERREMRLARLNRPWPGSEE